MNDETVTSKVNRLLQKSRQAFRIYSSMSKSARAEHNEYADMQAIEWKNINAELIRQLTQIVEKSSARNLAVQIARMRDMLLADFRRVESELNHEHREIIACCERADFIRVAQLSKLLISKKAFVQAAQAASHELSLIIDDKTALVSDNQACSSLGNSAPASFPGNTQRIQNPNSADDKLDHNNSNQNNTFTDHLNQEKGEIEQDTFEFDESALFPRLAKVIPLRR